MLQFHYGKPEVYHNRNRIGRKSLVGDIGLSRTLLEANALSFSLFGIRRIEDEIQIALL